VRFNPSEREKSDIDFLSLKLIPASLNPLTFSSLNFNLCKFTRVWVTCFIAEHPVKTKTANKIKENTFNDLKLTIKKPLFEINNLIDRIIIIDIVKKTK
jgi:hypothetical protein